MTEEEFYEFLDFRLDPRERLLSRAGQLVPLTVKEFELLLMLVESGGAVVGKDAMFEKLWTETFVEEGTLTRHISYLRKKLTAAAGPSAEPYIETLPKRDYRFLPPVVKTFEPEIGEPSVEAPLIQAENEPAHGREMPGEMGRDQDSLESDPLTGFEKEPGLLHLPIALRRKRFPVPVVFAVTAAIFLTAVTFIYFFALRPAPAAVVLTSQAVPFSGLPGSEDMPAFSPDGSRIVFSWNGGDRKYLDIYVKMIGEGEPVRLTDKNHDAVYPVFSPDGRQIAFFLSYPDRSEIYTISALGGAERKIADVQSGGTGLSWSSDGRFLAVADRLDADPAVAGLILIDLETGKKQPLTDPPGGARDFSPHFSPDGKSLAFLRAGEDARQDLYIKTEGGEPRRLTYDETRIIGFDWSAGGRAVVFNSKRQLTAPRLWQIAAGGGEPEPLVINAQNPTNLALAPGGRFLAYVESPEAFSVSRFDVDPSKKAAPAKLISYLRRDRNPQISPDGSQIVFNSNRTGENEIWISDAEGKNQRQLTSAHGLAGSPHFSPDGQLVAYDQKTDGKRDIFVVPSGGGAARQITADPAHDVLPAWSADGREIYFCSDRSGSYQLWKISFAPVIGAPVQLTQNGGVESMAAPDGKTLFYLKENGTGGLWSVSTAGGDEKAIAEIGGSRFWRSWAVTEKGIYFIAFHENEPYRIMLYDFAARRVTEAAVAEDKPVSLFPTISADFKGSVILFTRQDPNAGSIMLAKIADN